MAGGWASEPQRSRCQLVVASSWQECQQCRCGHRHNHWVKYTNWECDARVPLIFHHPKAPHTWGLHTQSLVEHVDLYPTTAELAGVPVQAAAHESCVQPTPCHGSGSGSGSGSGCLSVSVGLSGLWARRIEGSSYAALFAPGATPASTVWTNSHNASFTQYPRCGETQLPGGGPNFTAAVRCANVAKTEFAYMGFSMRTSRERSKPCPSSFVAIGPDSQDRNRSMRARHQSGL